MSTRSNRIPHILWNPTSHMAEQDCACAAVSIAPLVLSSSKSQADTDCACATAGLAATGCSEVDASTCLRRAPDLQRSQLNAEWEVVFNPLGPVAVTVLNAPAQRLLDSFSEEWTLANAMRALPGMPGRDVESAVQDLASVGLLRSDSTFRPDFDENSGTLIAWLQVTNACNLQCAYCYVTKDADAMDEATGVVSVEAVMRSAVQHGYRAVKLKYAGGEPTLNFEVVKTIHAHAQKLAELNGMGLDEVLLSNGVRLEDDTLAFLKSTGMRLMISLDGIGEEHDVQRHFADGRGSFVYVVNSIDRALAYDVKPCLSITVTKRNVSGLARAVAFALERELAFNLNFCRASSDGATCKGWVPQDQELASGVQDALSVVAGALPRQSFIGGLLDRASFASPHQYPCAAGRHYLVVDCLGRVSPCQMQMAQPLTTVRSSDPLKELRASQRSVASIRVDDKDGCHVCRWRYWCAGGCPLHTYHMTGHVDAKSPYCGVYQTLYPELVRLEGQRLLRLAKQPP